MKLVRHLVWFDLMSLSPVLGAWAGVLLLQAAVLGVGPPIPVTPQRPKMEIGLDSAAIVMRFAMTAVLVAVLVHRHLLVGTTAFWRTRPIPRVSVLASTLTSGILLTVVVPCLWFTGVFVWLGLDPLAAVNGALAIAGEQAVFAALALAVASVSANLAQVVVFGVATMAILSIGVPLAAGTSWQPALFTIVVPSAQWIGIASLSLYGTAIALVSVHQYLTLKTLRSKGLLAVVLVGFVFLRPFPLLKLTAAPPVADATKTLLTPDVSLDPASIGVENYQRTNDEGTDAGISHRARLTQSNSVGWIVLKPLSAVSTLAFPDGVSLNVSPRYVNAGIVADGETIVANMPYASLENAIDGAVLADLSAATAARYEFTFLETRLDVYAGRSTQPAVLDVTLVLEAYRHTIATRVPLDVGRQARNPRYAVEFVGTTTLEDGIAVDIREMYANEWSPIAPTYYVLRNRRLAQAVLATKRWERLFRSTTISDSGLVVCATRLEILPRARAAGGATLDRAWLEDAELLVLRPEVLGRVSKSIRISNFTLAPPKGPGSRKPELR